ncbi:DsbA family protein [Patescibacteria group bacterium]|nr:DsbA family protein [Patescibacteria group bacterium]
MKKFSVLLVLIGVFLSGCSDISVNDELDVPADIDIVYSKGNANAKLIITEYSEYDCSFCARMTLEVVPKLQDDYFESGDVQFIFKDFPLQNNTNSQMASEATYCAGEQEEGKYWEMHVKLFEKNNKLGKEDILKYAEDLGLNVSALSTCLEQRKYKNLVLRNKQDGLKIGVKATPTLVIQNVENGSDPVQVEGVQPYENLKKIIEIELKK